MLAAYIWHPIGLPLFSRLKWAANFIGLIWYVLNPIVFVSDEHRTTYRVFLQTIPTWGLLNLLNKNYCLKLAINYVSQSATIEAQPAYICWRNYRKKPWKNIQHMRPKIVFVFFPNIKLSGIWPILEGTPFSLKGLKHATCAFDRHNIEFTTTMSNSISIKYLCESVLLD